MTIAIAIIAGIGLVAAIALAVADRYLSVKEDPRIGMVTAALPGANCGGCGFPGCDGYARALVAGTAPNGACAAGGEACAKEIAKILGVEAAATERRVALVKCCGTRSEAIRVGDYNGICDCNVAAATAGGVARSRATRRGAPQAHPDPALNRDIPAGNTMFPNIFRRKTHEKNCCNDAGTDAGAGKCERAGSVRERYQFQTFYCRVGS